VGNVHGENAEPGAGAPGIRALAARPAGTRLPAIRALGIRPVDVLLTAVVIGCVELFVATATGAGQAPLSTLAYALGAVIALPVLLRHRWPLQVLLACSVLLVIFYLVDRRNITPAPLLVLPAYDAAAAGYLLWAIASPAVFMVIGLFVVEASSHYGLAALVAEFWTSIVLLALAVALGEVVRGRRKLAVETAERLRVAGEERDAEAARRVAEERLRIARDLHDTVAHSMATITVQAGSALHLLAGRDTDGAQRRGPGGPGAPHRVPAEDLRGALSAIRDTSKAALTEMRATLGRLRGGAGSGELNGEGASGDRAGGLDRVPALCDAVTAAGAPVRFEVTGGTVPLPPQVDQAAYRILQESLTNVLKHAGPDASAAVRICYQPGAVTITVADNGTGGIRDGGAPADAVPATGAGHGITGMTERAAALGGELSAGPRPDGGFQVTARLPVSDPGTEADTA
jgi:signal transduction histidine kinase